MRLAVLALLCVALGSAALAAPPDAAQAAGVVRAYFALLARHHYAAALRLRRGEVPLAEFVRAFGRYRTYRGAVGRPGAVEGAAGSSYVEVPVVVQGRRRNGAAFRERGIMTLRRVNDVDGSTAVQRRWHIERADVAPRFGP